MTILNNLNRREAATLFAAIEFWRRQGNMAITSEYYHIVAPVGALDDNELDLLISKVRSSYRSTQGCTLVPSPMDPRPERTDFPITERPINPGWVKLCT